MNSEEYSIEENDFYGNFVDPEPKKIDPGVVDAAIIIFTAASLAAGAALVVSVKLAIRLLKNTR